MPLFLQVIRQRHSVPWQPCISQKKNIGISLCCRRSSSRFPVCISMCISPQISWAGSWQAHAALLRHICYTPDIGAPRWKDPDRTGGDRAVKKKNSVSTWRSFFGLIPVHGHDHQMLIAVWESSIFFFGNKAGSTSDGSCLHHGSAWDERTMAEKCFINPIVAFSAFFIAWNDNDRGSATGNIMAMMFALDELVPQDHLAL